MDISVFDGSTVYPQPVIVSAKSVRKANVRFSGEPLTLLCEWENCFILKQDIEIFIAHISNEHLVKLDGVDLHCHWKDCEGFTENISELRRHILLHAFHAKIKCHGSNLLVRKKLPNCSASVQTRNIIPELPDPLLCCWQDCQIIYECPEHFYRHVDSHAEHDSNVDGIATCLWQDCNRTFSNNGRVKEHLRSHTQEKLIACPTCGGMFSTRTKFFDHIQRQLTDYENGPEGAYICEYCSRKLTTDRLLRDHMRSHVNHYKCPYCDMTCPTPSGIANHVAYRHSEKKPHACQYCDYRCKTESDLRKHLESHSMVPTYKCPVENCTYASRSQSCYRAHYRKKHEGKPPVKYSCHICEKVFSRGNYLTKHLLNHHKFRWPSGHCRFRYCLNEEGIYRLQTVRYESLELTQEMMGENSEIIDDAEDIDDPTSLLNTNHQTNQCVDNIPNVESESQVPNNLILHASNVNTNSVVLSVEEGKGIEPQNSVLINNTNFYLCNENATGNEPVLIKIVDSVDSTSDNASLNTVESGKEQFTAVESITQDSQGRMVFQTIEIITEGDPSTSEPVH